MDNSVKLSLIRGSSSLSLEGDADTVKSILSILTTEGLKELAPFFNQLETGSSQSSNGTSTSNGQNNQASETHTFKYHVDTIPLATSANEIMSTAFDLNGDGRMDNSFGALFISITQNYWITFQDGTDMAIYNNKINMLLTFQTTDPSLQNDDAATVTVYTGQDTIPTDDDTFVIDTNIPPVIIKGRLSYGHFVSDDPVKTLKPESMVFRIGTPSVDIIIELTLQALRMEFDITAGQISNGKVGGAILQSELNNNVIPQFADLFTFLISSESMYANVISKFFDTGGLTGNSHDGIITAEEISGNSLFQTVMTPDVRLYNAAGNYAPSDSDPKDCLSFGCAFSASHANF